VIPVLSALVIGALAFTAAPAYSITPSIAPPIDELDARPAVKFSPDGTGDLDGDGLRDVVAAHHYASGGVTITALRGTNGARLWSRTFSHLWSFGVARVGNPARSGLIVVTRKSEHVSGPSNERDRITMTVSALDGATATRLWTWQTVGNTTKDFPEPQDRVVWRNFPRYHGLLPGKGTAVHVLMTTTNSYRLIRPTSVQPIVIDGATGQPTSGGGAAAVENYNGLRPVGDLDADGLADYAFSSTDLVTRSSATGEVLWRRVGANGYFFNPIGDTTGDERDEVLFSNSLAADPATYLLDGATGSSIIERHGDFVELQSLGDANGDGFEDVFLADETSTPRSAKAVITGLAGNTGAKLWQRAYTLNSSTDDYPFISIYPVGDIQPDGAQEISVWLYRGGTTPDQNLFINGRTGGVQSMTMVGNPAFASIDGHGDDLLSQDDMTGTVRAIDPVSQHVIWTYTPQSVVLANLSAGQLTADGHADVVRGYETGSGFFVSVLDGANGTMRWSRKV
jgi:hypothetical protein